MTGNYRLASLQLGTALDVPVVPLKVPGALTRGTDSALCMLDGANRAPFRVSRLVRPIGLLGVKLERSEVPLRVTLRLLVDDFSAMVWDREQARLAGERFDEDEHTPSDASQQHRLVVVNVQGRTRGVLLIAPRTASGAVRQELVIDLDPAEVDDSGLLMIGFEQPAELPGWALAGALPSAPVGAAVARLVVGPVEGASSAGVSTGRPLGEAEDRTTQDPGFFVVNPGPGPVEVVLTPAGPGGERLRGRRARVKHPWRAIGQAVGDRRRQRWSGRVHVEAVDLDRRQLLDAWAERRRDGYHVTLPAGCGPALVRARATVGGQLRAVEWTVRTESA